MQNVSGVVESLLDELVSVTPQGQVVMMVNNLGGVSQLEMGIIVGEAMRCM